MDHDDRQAPRRVPSYVLYGEPVRAADPGFLHIEKLALRSARHGWEIDAHCHPGLIQIFWVAEGGGEARLDSRRTAFAGPALIVIPPPLVHGFTWRPGSDGMVLTIATACIAGLGTPTAHAFDQPQILALNKAQAQDIAATLAAIASELQFGARYMADAVAAHLRLLMVALLRLAPARTEALPGAELWQRFRDALESAFRRTHSVAVIAGGLPVTRGRLDALCRRHAGRTAQQVVHDRLILEAQRSLLYTGLTIAEIAYDLGFADPAYFSRFFARETGEAPGEYRKRHREG